MQALVTIVLPVYNVEKYLQRCLESVVNQTYSNLEIILVDDGSPDNCPSICDDWAKKDSRIKVIHKENAGLGMARNTGIDNATGEYIFFLDSDDSVDSTLVEKCVASAKENNSQVVVFSRHNIYDDGRVVSRKVHVPTLLFDNKGIVNELLPSMFTYSMGFGVSAWSKMYRLDTFKSTGVRFRSEREIVSEDAYFALEYYPKLNSVSVVTECLYNYYKRNDSLSRSYKPDRQERNDDFLRKSLEYIEENNLPDVIAINLMSRYHALTLGTMLQIVRADISEKERKAAIKEMFVNPFLRKTLRKDVFNLSSSKSAVFWWLLKFKCYSLCYFLLLRKTRK